MPCGTGRKSVTQADLEESIEVVIAGYQKKNAILTDHEKKHRGLPRDRPCPGGASRELRSGAEDHHHPPYLRRAGLHHAGGGGKRLPDEQGGAGKQDRTLTGGRAAEEVVFHSVTTGASNDIEQATKLAAP